jgi:sulfhydrogenase subunit gamma (sulfur reductase)
MSDWHDAKVVSNRLEAQGLLALGLDVSGTPLAGSHQVPGQYVKLALEGVGEGFFAIASTPDPRGRTFEFLIKGGAAVADALRVLPAGATVRVSPVQGKGFPLASARGKNVLLFATGSGISPVRSLINLIRQDRSAYKHVHLYFGVRSPDAFAYTAELTQWEGEGIKVVKTVSQPGNSGWEGLTGYVQSHVPAEPLADSVAYLCGQKAMVQGVTEALIRQGLSKGDIFLNF